LLALLGVSVETAVILVSYINKLRLEGRTIREATLDASLLRLRPIMMTALVACLGLLPAALSTGVGSDTQKPFAIVVVAGLISRLLLGFFVNPVLYEVVAREGDVLGVSSTAGGPQPGQGNAVSLFSAGPWAAECHSGAGRLLPPHSDRTNRRSR
jgi:predicted RND superfamily exporter protein